MQRFYQVQQHHESRWEGQSEQSKRGPLRQRPHFVCSRPLKKQNLSFKVNDDVLQITFRTHIDESTISPFVSF